jgi:energy-converting hydrogenase Eha subunit G
VIVRVPPQYDLLTWSMSVAGDQYWFVVPPKRLPDLIVGMTKFLVESGKKCHNQA